MLESVVSRFSLGTTGLELSPFAHTLDKFLDVVVCRVQGINPFPAFDQVQPEGTKITGSQTRHHRQQ